MESNERTVREWYDLLPPFTRDLAIKSLEDQYELGRLDLTKSRLYDAIDEIGWGTSECNTCDGLDFSWCLVAHANDSERHMTDIWRSSKYNPENVWHEQWNPTGVKPDGCVPSDDSSALVLLDWIIEEKPRTTVADWIELLPLNVRAVYVNNANRQGKYIHTERRRSFYYAINHLLFSQVIEGDGYFCNIRDLFVHGQDYSDHDIISNLRVLFVENTIYGVSQKDIACMDYFLTGQIKAGYTLTAFPTSCDKVKEKKGAVVENIVVEKQKELTLQERVEDFISKWKFGMEVTFMYSVNAESLTLGDADMYQRFLTKQVYLINDSEYVKHKWMSTGKEDACSLEIPSPVYSYADRDKFLEDYDDLVNKLAEFNFEPSSVVDEYIEGGCHINFGTYELKNIYPDGSEALAENLYRNMSAFINRHYSVVWAFLSPNDNKSSNIVVSPAEKGHFATIRECSDFRSRIELRFFMQPRDMEEMELHLDFSYALMSYLLRDTMSGKITLFNGREKALNKTTFEESVEMLKEACRIIKFPFKRLVKCGKIEQLRRRHENEEFGVDYLK